MTSQLHAQYKIAVEHLQHHVEKLRDDEDYQLFSVCDRLVDFDVPEISNEEILKGFKKVQYGHNKSKKRDKKALDQKNIHQSTLSSNTVKRVELPLSSQQIDFCVDNQRGSRMIPPFKPTPTIPIDSEEVQDQSLERSDSLSEGSENIPGNLSVSGVIEFSDRSIEKYNSIDISWHSEDISEGPRSC